MPIAIKKEILTGEFKNTGWGNDFGYPVEEFIDDDIFNQCRKQLGEKSENW